MSDTDELDVDFEVIEEPQDIMFPRLPNVISHRGHKIKILAIVRNVPEPEPNQVTTISLKARILVLDHERVGEKEHTSCAARIWGEGPEETVTFPSNGLHTLPFTIETIVPKRTDDDHLGEGPGFNALINVKTSSTDPTAPAVAAGGGQERGGDASRFSDNGLYIINFMSR